MLLQKEFWIVLFLMILKHSNQEYQNNLNIENLTIN